MDKSKHLESFFNQENTRMRREIRAMDLMCEEINCDRQNNQQQTNYPQEVNFLAIGPQHSGKLSLIKTIHFALNGHQNLQTDTINLSDTVINRHNIKHSKVQRVEGLKFMKETSQKLSILGFQIQQKSNFQNQKPFLKMTTKQKLNKFTQKYSKILNLLDIPKTGDFTNNFMDVNNLWRTVSYLADKNDRIVLSNLKRVKVILIVVNMLSLPVSEEIQCLKFFVSELRKKGLKVLVILTHIDGLNHLFQSQRLNFIEQKIHYLKKKLNIYDREDFICIQSYKEFQSGHRDLRQRDNEEKVNQITKIKSVDCQHRRRIATEQITVQVPIIRNRFNTKVSLSTGKQGGHSNFSTAYPMRVSNNNYQASRLKEKNSIADLSRVRSSDLFNCSNSNAYHYYKLNCNNALQGMLQSSEQRNFYSLKLLLRIIKQSKKESKSIPNQISLFQWLCG